MASPSYREIITSIKTGDCAPVYILMGEEAYFIDLIVEAFEKYVVPEEDRDFNCNVFYGNDADVNYVVAAAQQFPMMSDRRLVLLKEAQTMQQAKAQLEKFASYVAQPNQTTVFVIAYKGEPFAASSKLMKGAKEGGAVVFTSPVVRDYQLPPYIKDYCAARKVSIEDKAVALLAEYVGNPLSKLFGELQKLISIGGVSSGRITCEDIERNIGISKDYNNFELTDAIGSKNYPKAMKIVSYYEKNPKANPTPKVMGTLISFFTNLLTAHYLGDKSDDSIMRNLGFKSRLQVNNMRTALSRYSAMQTVNAIHYLREFDVKSKGVDSAQNEYALMKELVFKLFT